MGLGKPFSDRRRKLDRFFVVSVLALGLSATAAALALYAVIGTRPATGTAGTGGSARTSALDRIRAEGVLRAGYGGFPPYTIINLESKDPRKRVTGFAVDMVEEIARRHTPPLRVEWHNLNWETMKADMDSGKFDFLADAVYQTVPRALDFGLTEPFSYFGIAVAVVRKDETRFQTFQDLNRDDVTIALAEGWTSSEFARAHLTRPKFKSVSVDESAVVQLDEVLFGRADAALNDVPTVVQYVRAHADRVKALWLDSPPSTVPAGFVTRRDEPELLNFLNACIRILKADGTLDRLDRRWNALGSLERARLVPGAGLK